MLASAPFELVYREPTPESLKAVMDFARKTGDFSSLSVVDLRVLALTYTIEKETKGNVEHLRKEPVRSGVSGFDALFLSFSR
jgi:RNA-binding protein NOB1